MGASGHWVPAEWGSLPYGPQMLSATLLALGMVEVRDLFVHSKMDFTRMLGQAEVSNK